jgi:CTP:molybdopterin cytidylyltransferase MocA
LTEYEDRAGHPYLLSRAALDEAAEVEGPKVLWRLLSYDDSGRVTRVTVSRSAPRDINTPEDFEAFVGDE